MSTIITIEARGCYTPSQAQSMIKSLCSAFRVLAVRKKERAALKELPHVFGLFDTAPRCANDDWHDRAVEAQKDKRLDLAAIRNFRLSTVGDPVPDAQN